MSTATLAVPDVMYPESDGRPMADNTVQWRWMVKIVDELRDQFAGRDVFVAGDLLWYPVEGQPRINAAPDAMVVFGRPADDRGSYRQWHEDGVAPQVVFEVLSPSNSDADLDAKLAFYDAHGVEEYYVIDPDDNTVEGHIRRGEHLGRIRKMLGFISPRLGIRFEKSADELVLLTPDGRPFQTRQERVGELAAEIRKSAIAAAGERERASAEQKRANAEQKRADAEAAAKVRLAHKLRELGIDPDAV